MNAFYLKMIQGFPSRASAHAKLTSPIPRDPQSGGGNKMGPCGPIAKQSTTTATFNGGQTITVNWTEVINHPGRFLFAVSKDQDKSFQNIATVIDTKNSSGSHDFTTTLQIPNINCDNCTLQLIQSMEENPSAPTYYYSCADIKILATATSTPTPTPTPTATPKPSPTVTVTPSPPPSETVTTQSSTMGSGKSLLAEGTKFGGGCATIKRVRSHEPRSTHPWAPGEFLFVLLLPILTWLLLRRSVHGHRN